MPVNSSNTAGLILNVGAVGISGAVFGMPVEALILGGIAGALAHGMGKPAHNPALTVLTSLMLAGTLSPTLRHYAAQYLGLPQDFLRAAVPFAVGLAWPWAWPVVAGHLRRLIDGFLSRLSGGVK